MNSILKSDVSGVAKTLIVAVEELLSAGFSKNSAIVVHELEGLCERVKSARTGFPFSTEQRPSQEINRLGSVLLGPVFTSQSHPWPIDEDSNPMAPLCQLNTSQFPESISVVEGLVQVWLPQSSMAAEKVLIRIIPSSEVNPASITPVISHDANIEALLPEAADWLQQFHCALKPSRKDYLTEAAIKLGYTGVDEMSDADGDEWNRLTDEYYEKFGDDVVLCWQITGFEAGRLYCCSTLDQKDSIARLEKLQKNREKGGPAADLELVSLLAKVCKYHRAWVELCGHKAYPCLFGTFNAIQYSAEERGLPVICFESIGMREWGDGGNAQVFYSKESGFYFDWSCT